MKFFLNPRLYFSESNFFSHNSMVLLFFLSKNPQCSKFSRAIKKAKESTKNQFRIFKKKENPSSC